MLKGKNVILRPPVQDDLILLNKWHNNHEIKKQALLHPFPVSVELDSEWLNNLLRDKSNRSIFFCIVNSVNELIGYTFLSEIDWVNRNCSFGIVIGETGNQGKGYGRETLEIITDYTFNTLNLHKVTLKVAAYNSNAIKLYENFGFMKEGVLKEQVLNKNLFSDVIIYSIFNKV